MRDAQNKEETALLLVPKSLRKMLLHVAHHNPIAEHLGQDEKLNHHMAYFYWLGFCGVCRWCAWPPSTYWGPLWNYWYGPHWAFRMESMRTLLWASFSRVCNAIPGSSGSACSIGEALCRVVFRVRIPKQTMTDQCTNCINYLGLKWFAPVFTIHEQMGDMVLILLPSKLLMNWQRTFEFTW